MITVNTRPLSRNEITDEESSESLVYILSKSEGVRECKGSPRRLKMFAKDLNEGNFKAVQTRLRILN